MKLPLIKTDKANHFIYGNLFALVFSLFFNAEISLLIVFIIAVSKEIYDKTNKGTAELMDIIWTVLGALTIYLAVKI